VCQIKPGSTDSRGANHGDLTFPGFDTNIAKPWSSQQVMQGIMSFLTKHLGR
jgi:hypothetical protein